MVVTAVVIQLDLSDKLNLDPLVFEAVRLSMERNIDLKLGSERYLSGFVATNMSKGF